MGLFYGICLCMLSSFLPMALAIHELASGCGVKGKQCVGNPKDCLATPTTCTHIAAVSTKPTGLLVEVQALGITVTSSRWVAVGFSEDDHMGKDLVVHCFQNGTLSFAELTYNPEHFNLQTGIDQKYLHVSEAKTEDGELICSAMLDKKVTVQEHEFDFATTPHHLLLANGPVKAGVIGKHEKTPVATAKSYIF